MMLNILIVLGVIVCAVMYVAVKSESQIKPYIKKCGCGKTKDADGYCDGSHDESR